MGRRLINVDEVEEIVPVLVGKLLENNLITEERANGMTGQLLLNSHL